MTKIRKKRGFIAVLFEPIDKPVLNFESVWKVAILQIFPNGVASQKAKLLVYYLAFNQNIHKSLFNTTTVQIPQMPIIYWMKIIQPQFLLISAKKILYLNCWSIYRFNEFKDFMKNEYFKHIRLHVPENCTDIFSLCNISLWLLFNHSIKYSKCKFLIDYRQNKLANDKFFFYVFHPANLDSFAMLRFNTFLM